jgi:hypothetical protein
MGMGRNQATAGLWANRCTGGVVLFLPKLLLAAVHDLVWLTISILGGSPSSARHLAGELWPGRWRRLLLIPSNHIDQEVGRRPT